VKRERVSVEVPLWAKCSVVSSTGGGAWVYGFRWLIIFAYWRSKNGAWVCECVCVCKILVAKLRRKLWRVLANLQVYFYLVWRL
jgi:hypothetical protein